MCYIDVIKFENFVNIYSTSSNQERAELANQIDIHKIRITNVQFNQEDGSVSITFSTEDVSK